MNAVFRFAMAGALGAGVSQLAPRPKPKKSTRDLERADGQF